MRSLFEIQGQCSVRAYNLIQHYSSRKILRAVNGIGKPDPNFGKKAIEEIRNLLNQ